ncbi:methyl-accepting chemotaxis protein [Paraburkholderia saeva]|uniref:hypothetical protein n=1 Tax=Paraburkholderia saeva TaxID=2777537 RepID=UPI001D643A82|nr:hypothetical protein [Paraburkholderia saeva]CAG4886891.1 hypothetical protein R52603_00278 [Paraburkholderia saeva]CAG4899013.1 hypothetical protein R70241_02559 [Paraburkholderia saeva]
MKRSNKLFLAFAAALLLMFAGAMYGASSLQRSLGHYSAAVKSTDVQMQVVARVSVISAALMLAACTGGLIGAVVFRRRIARLIDAGGKGAETAFASPFEGTSADEIAALRAALVEIQSSLSSVGHHVSQNVAATSIAVSQNVGAQPHHSSRTEAQAASLEETMVRIEKLIATVRQNSVGAKRASLLAVRTSGAQEEVLRAA